MSRTKNATRNIFWGIISKTIHMILPFALRTMIIYTLGTLYLGIGSLFTSILIILNSTELGLSSVVTYSMYKPVADRDDVKVCMLLNFYKKCYKAIGMGILFLGILLIPSLKYLISGDYPSELNIYILYLLYLLNTVIGYVLFAYKRILFTVNQRNDVESKVASITSIFQYLSQIAALWLFHNFYLFVIVLNISTLLDNVIVNIVARRFYPHYVGRGTLGKENKGQLVARLGDLIMQKFGSVVLISADNIVISIFLGLTMVAKFGNYYAIITSLNSIVAVVRNSIVGGIGSSVASEPNYYNLKIFKALNLLYFFFITIVSIMYLCLIQPFMNFWMGNELMFDDYIAALFSLQFFSMKWCDMLCVFQEACGLWKKTKFISIIAATVNLITNIILVQTIGIAGVLVSTIVSGLFVYNMGYAYILFKEYFGLKYNFLVYSLKQLYLFLVAFLDAVVCFTMCNKFFGRNVFDLFYRGCFVVLVGTGILLMGSFKLSEFSDSVRYIKGVLKNTNSR